jgi:Fe-S-cluster containining protein
MSPPTIELPAVASPAATAALEQMLRALQGALRRAMAAGPAAAEDVAFQAELDEAMAAYDRFLAVVVAHHPMSCARGCAACCRDNPDGVAGVEILRLQARLQAEGRAEAVGAAAAEGAALFRDAAAALGREEALATWRRRGRRCPLLGADGACTVYTLRPVACRMFHALSPAAWCAPGDPRHAERQHPHLLPPLACRQLLGAISRCLGRPASTSLLEGLAQR